MTSPLDDLMDEACESVLLVFPALQALDTIRALDDQDIRPEGWYFGFHEMSILLSRIISSIQDFETCNIDHEHAGTNDVTRVVWRERKSGRRGYELMCRDGDDVR